MRIFFCLIATLTFATNSFGHGTPIDVSLEGNRIVVSHPLDETFAPPIFGQPDEFDDFSDVDSFPPTGNVILWDMPGLDIHGLNGSANLSIEILARPVIGSAPAEHRVLWYWNPETEVVEQSPAEFHLFGTDARVLTLQPEAEQSPSPFLLASQLTGQTGFHNHSLVFYGLDDDATAPAGVYGFFARFISNQYTASDPFLILFNYATDYELLAPASLAMHAAATLPGDFDLDDDIDGRDFLIWQHLAGSTTRTLADISLNGVVDAVDLGIWQENYGTKFGGLTAISAVQIPEPSSGVMVMMAVLIAVRLRCSRKAR